MLRQITAALTCLASWEIGMVTVCADDPRGRIVWLYDRPGYWPCPICHQPIVKSGHSAPHVFRVAHRRGALQTYVYAQSPLVHCPRHGWHEVPVPWMQESAKWRTLSDARDRRDETAGIVEPSQAERPEGAEGTQATNDPTRRARRP